MLYGNNLWRLSGHAKGYQLEVDPQPSGILLNEACQDFWVKNTGSIRHVLTGFDSRDVDQDDAFSITNWYFAQAEYINEDEILRGRDSWDCRAEIHGEEEFLQLHSWNAKTYILERMDLETLYIEADNVFCTARCCRYAVMKRLCRDTLAAWAHPKALYPIDRRLQEP